MTVSSLSPEACGSRRFEGRIAIVTGAAQGIGRATALRLAAEGAAVMIADLVADAAETTAEAIRSGGERAASLALDLRNPVDAERLVDATVEEFGAVDALVNNVGGSRLVKPFTQFESEEIEADVAQSLFTALWCCRSAVPHMLERGYGAIVNVGSNAPRGRLRVPYAAAKGGVFALTTSLAMELATFGVRVNCVAPGGTVVDDRVVPRSAETDPESRHWHEEMVRSVVASIPMERRGRPHEIAAAIAFFASDDASFVTGQILSVAGGATVP